MAHKIETDIHSPRPTMAGLAVFVVALQLLACDRAKTRHKDDNTTPRSSLVSPEHSRRNESVEALATREPFGVSKKIKNDPEGALRFWIASRDNYRKEEWDDMMGKYLILDDIPLALREQAYSLLSPSSRLECACDLFRHYLEEKTTKECWAFYNSLPYDSVSQRQVSALFWESVLRGCDLDATAKQLTVFKDEYGHGVDFLIKNNLPNIAGSSEVAAFLERLPPQYRTGEMIMKLSSSESVSISYADVWSLFQDSERNNFRDQTIKNLARKGAMTHKDLLDYMQTESSIGFDKLDVLIDFFRPGRVVSVPVTEFEEFMQLPVGSSMLNQYVREVAPTIVSQAYEQAMQYAALIPNAEVRKKFIESAAVAWTHLNQTTNGNPYLKNLDEASRSAMMRQLESQLGRSAK